VTVDARIAGVPIPKRVVEKLTVKPGERANLRKRDPAWKADLVGLDKQQAKQRAQEELASYVEELEAAQETLWASDRYALLVIFQALDAAGKDGTIKHVMSGVNPQGCEVHSFKQPSAEELDHDFLWRSTVALPERGRIGIFNRSYYEEVLVVRVHPEVLEHEKLPPGRRDKAFWDARFDAINTFERHLDRNGTKIVKFFLNVSKEEQRRRFLDRLEEPGKEWKFSAADVAEREHWDEYQRAYEAALTATSTEWAPWYVIPADHKPVMRELVAGVLAHTIRSLHLSYPTVSGEQHEANEAARRKLEAQETAKGKR